MNNHLSAMIFISRPDDGRQRPLMLSEMLLKPLLAWVADSLRAAGVNRFYAVCAPEHRLKARSCFAEDTAVVFLTGDTAAGNKNEDILVMTRPALLMAGTLRQMEQYAGQLGIYATCLLDREQSRTGAYLFSGAGPSWLAQRLCDPAGLDAALELEGVSVGDFSPGEKDDTVTVHDYARLQAVQQVLRSSVVGSHIEAGVSFLSPDTAFISPETQIGAGTVIMPNVILRGQVRIGCDCRIGPNTLIENCEVGDESVINASQVFDSVMGRGANIGPFAYIRPGCELGSHVKVGGYVELKKVKVGDGTKIPHLSYVGDADVGSRVNISCGAITANYNGAQKSKTKIGDDAFIGCNVNMIAPVDIGGGAYIAAGSTVNKPVPEDALAIARARQENKPGWAARYRQQIGEKQKEQDGI